MAKQEGKRRKKVACLIDSRSEQKRNRRAAPSRALRRRACDHEPVEYDNNSKANGGQGSDQ